MSLDLLSSTSRIETPFIIAEIAGVSFGIYNTTSKDVILNNSQYNAIVATYPNFMKSLEVTKINGTVNTYTLQMTYAITAGDDPNLLEKIFSKIKKDRTMYLSYGDLSMPNYIYKKEEVLVTKIRSNVSFDGSQINYTISAVSKSLQASAGNYSFGKRVAKPSDVIKELLYDNKYSLLDIFYGMRDREKTLLNNLIASDDATVTIQAKSNISIIKYLEYLVQCMVPSTSNLNSILKSSVYKISIYDDILGDFEGPYFKVSKVSSNIRKDTLNVYEINIGYPDASMVMDFSIDDDEVFSILYDYAGNVNQPQYIQRIDNKGNLISEYSPTLSSSSNLMITTEQDKTWWTNMTSFPIKTTLKLKGLLKPTILMSYIYLDVRFYGQKHYSSGYYVITKQQDSISAQGFRTTLSLLKVGGDNDN